MNPFHSVVSGTWTRADAANTGRDASVPPVGVMARPAFSSKSRRRLTLSADTLIVRRLIERMRYIIPS